MEKNFYINFDFSLRGDYKGLFKWLDKNNAEERGNGYALIKKYDFPDNELDGVTDPKEKSLKLVSYLRKDIKEVVKISPSDRIYLTFLLFETENLGGIFLFGNKQAPPWEGSFQDNDEPETDLEQL